MRLVRETQELKSPEVLLRTAWCHVAARLSVEGKKLHRGVGVPCGSRRLNGKQLTVPLLLEEWHHLGT